MIENFLIQCKTRKMEVLQFLVAAFGGYVFGIIVMMIIRANTVEKECVTLGMLIGSKYVIIRICPQLYFSDTLFS